MDKTSKKVGVAFGLGALAGWLVSVLMPESTKQKSKEKIENTAQNFKRVLTDPEERERIREIFGDRTRNAAEKYEEVKNRVSEKLGNLRMSISSIDKNKYSQIIGETVDELKNEGRFASEQAKKLKNYLEQDYKKLKNQTEENTEEEVV